MSTIKFTPVDEVPGAGKGGPGKFIPVFEYLRSDPGKTVKLDGKHYANLCTRIKRGEVRGCEPGEFFATSRNVELGQADIYVTYVGPKSNEDFHDKTVAL